MQGSDGKGFVSATVTRAGELEFTRTDGEIIKAGAVVGPEGKAGVDGSDGWSFEDFSIRQIDDRKFAFTYERDGVKREKELYFPVQIHRGVYKQGDEYVTNDVVTYRGSQFIAVRNTKSKPLTDDAWTLVVKCGRDGKDGQKGEKGERGEVGRPGRDLTQTDGKNKW